MGGLSRTTKEATRILDACGRDIIIIETVGVGQSELDVAKATDTVIVMLTPESGDSVQIMKAGLIEIADIFVVNKCDRHGADNIAHSLKGMLDRIDFRLDWRPPIFMTAASLNKGIDELYEGLWERYRYLDQDNHRDQRRRRQAEEELKNHIEAEFSKMIWKEMDSGQEFGEILEDVWMHRIDPQNAAREIVSTWVKKETQLVNKNHGAVTGNEEIQTGRVKAVR